MPEIEAVKDLGDVAALRRQTAQRLGLGEELAVDGSVSPLACRVGLILVFKFNKREGYASWPYSKLAEWVNRSERQVQTAAKELAARNYVRIQRTRRGWTLYRLVIDEPRAGDQDTREIASLEPQDRKPASTLDRQDTMEIAGLDAKIGSFSHQDRKFSASRPEAGFHQYTDYKFPENNTCSPLTPLQSPDGQSVELGKSARRRYGALASAIAAISDEAGLSEVEAEPLVRCRLDVGSQLLIAKTEADFNAIRGSRAAPAIKSLGLHLGCGAVR